jgi:hypothetical protein
MENNVPYFIGISIDFVGGFDLLDFVDCFRGRAIQFIDYGKTSPFYLSPEISNPGSTFTELGLFYSNPHLSGLILKYSGEILMLLNPS